MRSLGLVSIVLVLGVGYVLMQRSVGGGPDQASPEEQIDVVSVRQQLLVIGQAERQYLAIKGTYATLEQLQEEDLLPGGIELRGYSFSAVADGATGFTVTATPSDASKAEWPVLEIDERMQVAER
jgi:hypothetical protein